MEGWRGDGSLGGVYGGHGWRFFWRSRVYTIQRACIRFISQWWLSWREGVGGKGERVREGGCVKMWMGGWIDGMDELFTSHPLCSRCVVLA